MTPEQRIESIIQREDEEQGKVVDALEGILYDTWPDLIAAIIETGHDTESLSGIFEKWAELVIEQLAAKIDFEQVIRVAKQHAVTIANAVDYEGNA